MNTQIRLRSPTLDMLIRGKRLTDRRIEQYELAGFYGPDRRKAARIRKALADIKRVKKLTKNEIKKRYL